MAGRAGQARGRKGKGKKEKNGEEGKFCFSTFPGEEAHLVEVRMGGSHPEELIHRFRRFTQI